MNDTSIKLMGDKELLAAFRELDFVTQHKRLHQVLSDAARIPKKAVRQVIPTRSEKLSPPSSGARARRTGANKWHPPGLGRRSVMQKRGRSKKSATLFVGLRSKTGSYKTDAYYLRIWDLHSPGKEDIVNARDGAVIPTQKAIYNSMRTVIKRAWAKHAKR